MCPSTDYTALNKIADALERLSPPVLKQPDIDAADVFVWSNENRSLYPVSADGWVDLRLLLGVEHAQKALFANTEQFAKGYSANHALLWGARGMGKSSLIKAVFQAINKQGLPLKLIEIYHADLSSLPDVLQILWALQTKNNARFIVFCDDLSFQNDASEYKSLKSLLDGGVVGCPNNTIFYATSNRRHLLPRSMIENEQSTAIMPAEAIEEKVSLSDRFGLWLGFHPCDQETYLRIIECYCNAFGVLINKETLHKEAIEWQLTRGARSGRVAWQYVKDLAGRLHIDLKTKTNFSKGGNHV